MIEERGVVAAGAKCANAKISACARVLASVRGAPGQPRGLAALPHRNLFLRIGNVTGHRVHELLQRVRALHVKKAAAIAVSINVDGGVLVELVGMELSPFSGAEQHGLFTIPGAINDGAL